MKPCVVALPGAEACAAHVASNLRAPLCRLEHRRFPDGETYLRVLDPVRARDVIVVAQLRDPDPRLPGLLFLADTLRELGAASVGLAAPYLPYMRQDERFHAGEAVTARSFARWISSSFDWLATVDPHLHRIASLDALYGVPSAVAPSAPAIALWIQGHVARPCIVGPDAESAQWVAAVADLVGCERLVMHKVRRGDREVEVELPDPGHLRGRTPVVVDDIVSSAHTMAQAVRGLRAAGLDAPVCVGVHAVFADGAEEVLRQAGAGRVVTCNTLVHPTNGIDVTPALAEAAAVLRLEMRRRRVAQRRSQSRAARQARQASSSRGR